MPDWAKIVRQRLANLALEDDDPAQVFDEIASHLEENYRSLLNEGCSEEEALCRTLADAGDWQVLRKKIELSRKKEFTVPQRVKQFWIPALLTLFCSMVLLMLIQFFGPQPTILGSSSKLRITPVAVVYISWLITLPFVGAAGAYLSTRAGGRPRAVFTSIIFPILPYLAFFLVGLPVALILDDRVAHNITIPAFFVGLCAWVIFPGVALLAGGLAAQYLTIDSRPGGIARS